MRTAAFFPDGVGIRNFVLGDFLPCAAQYGEVFAFHDIPDDHLATYRGKCPSNVQWHRCIRYQDDPVVCFWRKSLSFAHLHQYDNMAMSYARKLPIRGNVKARALAHAAKAYGRISASPAGIQKLAKRHDRAAQSLPSVAQYAEKFRSLQPTVMFCSHQRSLEVIPAALAAKAMGIPTATFIFSWDNITSKGRIAAPFDHFMVWSDQMRAELMEYYPEVPADNIHVVGTPQFDPYADDSLIWSRDEFCQRVGADPNRPIVCYSGGEPGTTPEDQAHLRILMELVSSGQIEGNPQVLLRPAPVTRSDERVRYGEVSRDYPELIYCKPEWLQTKAGDWTSVIPSQQDVQFLANLTNHVDLNINVASTMTLDFCIRDKPVVNVGFNATKPIPFGVPLKDYYYQFEHYRPVLEIGASRLANNREELANYVNMYLDDPSVDREQRRKFVEFELDLPVGRSSEKITKVLQQIARVSAMRLCFVCHEYPPGPHGGIGTFTQVLARGLAAAGHDVRVAGMYRPDYPSPDYEEDRGVKVWRFRKLRKRWGWIVGRYRLYQKIRRWSADGDIELVEVPDWTGAAAAWPRLPVPVVARLNGSASYFAKEIDGAVGWLTHWLEKSSMRRVDFWSSVSQYTADRTRSLFQLDSGPHAILYNPVELVPANLEPRSGKDVLFTGTLTEKKGVISLFEAWPRVVQQLPDARLHVYGKDRRTLDGRPMQELLQSMLTDQQQETVVFLGHVNRETLFDHLRSARAAVFPSYAEAFALAPLEAMACGCPTIYSTRGSGTELMTSGTDGILIDPDQPQAIAEAIVRLLTDDSLALQIGLAGRQRIEQRFSIDQLIAKNESFFRRCIEQYAAHRK